MQIAGICQTQPVPARSYVSNNAVLVCDAAHGMLSSHETLSGLALEEALILVTLLGRVTSRFDVSSALRAYDEVCRPRAELVMRASCDIVLLMTGRAPGV
ncbi:NAD(P)/FAD-dependent oxidoreductase, partial [Erythrobacter sp. YJ-T3-07]|uniref:FAD-dependent oxidoreductase n=1 Tax=Erythrobacter sp. YJ-T3-07 TaxID=2793063 RepID=UPI001F46AE20